MFPVCAGIETVKVKWSEDRRGCFPCVRELKYIIDYLKLQDGMFPVCAGIEMTRRVQATRTPDVSRVCGN